KLSTFPPRGARLIGYGKDEIDLLLTRARAMNFAAEVRGAEIFLPDEAALDPTEALSAISAAPREKGGEGRRGARATGIEGNAARIENGSVETADVIVVATGAWSADLVTAPAITPTKGQILEVESDVLAPGETMRGPHAYAVGRAKNRVT